MNRLCSQIQDEKEDNRQCCLERRHVDVLPRAFDGVDVAECRSNALSSLPGWEGSVAGDLTNQA